MTGGGETEGVWRDREGGEKREGERGRVGGKMKGYSPA